MDQADPDPLQPSLPPRTPPRASCRRSVVTNVSWSAATSASRAMRSTSQPGWMDGAVALIASRSRRLIRFRTTAEPSARPVAMPNRVVSRSVRRNLAARSGWDRMVPRSWSAAKSWGLESVTTRDRIWARSSVRPTGVFDREPGVRQGRVDRRWTSSGRGSRAPWRDGASWAGRSASSGLRGILSIRPRGLVEGLRPLEAPNAPWRPSALARSSSVG